MTNAQTARQSTDHAQDHVDPPTVPIEPTTNADASASSQDAPPATTTAVVPKTTPAKKAPSAPAKKSAAKGPPMLTRDQVIAETKRLKQVDPNDPFERLRAGLMMLLLDPIAMNTRNREAIDQLIVQAQIGVSTVTGLAQHYGVEMDGSPVAESCNFGEWDPKRLNQLNALLGAEIDRIHAAGMAGIAEAERARSAESAQREETQRQRARAEEFQSMYAALLEQNRQRALEINTAVAAYSDQEWFVVAQLDPTTRQPVRYARLEITEDDPDGRLTSTDRLNKSTRFPDFGQANDLRLRVESARRDRAKYGVVGADQPTISVMQLSLRPVRVEDL